MNGLTVEEDCQKNPLEFQKRNAGSSSVLRCLLDIKRSFSFDALTANETYNIAQI